MKLLERSFTTRTTRTGRGDDSSMLPDLTGTSDHAMNSQRPDLSRRPYTSSGIDTRRRSLSKANGNGVKSPIRSEDLEKAGRVVEITDGLDTFRFPTPSPRVPPRSATFQYSPSPLQYESPRIGIAIGSPSHAPPSWGRSLTADDLTTLAKQQPPSRAPPAPPQQLSTSLVYQEQRRKKTSWKSFGGLFRKTSKIVTERSSSREKSALNSFQSPDLLEVDTPRGIVSPSSRSPRPISRSQRWQTPSQSQHQCERDTHERRDRTSHSPAKLVRGMSTPSPRIKPLRESTDLFQQSPLQRAHTSTEQETVNIEQMQLPIPRAPKLLLDFPKPEFDRYSVMFENFLSTESKPSLFDRRQSRLRRKKSEQFGSEEGVRVKVDALTFVPQRSLTSPHLTSRLSIRVNSMQTANLPTIGNESPAERRPQQLHRSKTAPPGTTSPMREILRPECKVILEISSESRHSTLFSENSLPPTPTSATTYTDTESIKQAVDDSEPAWEMVTSKPAAVASPHLAQGKPYPRIKSPEDLERHIVQVSVARQVSVSRARTRVSRAMETKQPLRPRIVDLTKNRKSIVGVLEGADVEEDIEPVPEMRTLARNEKMDVS